MVWSLAKNARPRTQKQVMRCRPQGKRRTPDGTQLRWVNLLNRDLAEIPNWQELVQGRDIYMEIIYQTQDSNLLSNPTQRP